MENEDMPSITITHGYSREHRPDLKQFVVDLMSTSDADVPLYFRAADGNEADKAVFADLIKDFKQQVDVDALFVADSALFSKENLQSLTGLSWLTRVPQTVKEAKRLLSELEESDFEASSVEGYKIAERQVSYGGISQRWLIIASDEAQTRSSKQQRKTLGKQGRAHNKALRALSRRTFHCQEDAEQALEAFKKTLTLHRDDPPPTPRSNCATISRHDSFGTRLPFMISRPAQIAASLEAGLVTPMLTLYPRLECARP